YPNVGEVTTVKPGAGNRRIVDRYPVDQILGIFARECHESSYISGVVLTIRINLQSMGELSLPSDPEAGLDSSPLSTIAHPPDKLYALTRARDFSQYARILLTIAVIHDNAWNAIVEQRIEYRTYRTDMLIYRH